VGCGRIGTISNSSKLGKRREASGIRPPIALTLIMNVLSDFKALISSGKDSGRSSNAVITNGGIEREKIVLDFGIRSIEETKRQK